MAEVGDVTRFGSSSGLGSDAFAKLGADDVISIVVDEAGDLAATVEHLQLRIFGSAHIGHVAAAAGKSTTRLPDRSTPARCLRWHPGATLGLRRRDRSKKPSGVGVLWIVEDLVGWTDLGDPSGIHDGDSVAHSADERQIVADVQHRRLDGGPAAL